MSDLEREHGSTDQDTAPETIESPSSTGTDELIQDSEPQDDLPEWVNLLTEKIRSNRTAVILSLGSATVAGVISYGIASGEDEPSGTTTRNIVEVEGPDGVIERRIVERFSPDDDTGEAEQIESSEITDEELIPPEFMEHSGIVQGRIEEIIQNNRLEDKEYKHIRELTITFWRGLAVREIETTDGQTAYLRFENPLVVEIDRDDLYLASYHQATGNLITFYSGHVVRGETMDDDDYIYVDKDRNKTGWIETYLYAKKGDEHNGQLVYMTPKEIGPRGIYGRDDAAQIIRGGPSDVHSTVSITTSESEAHANVDRDRGRDGRNGRLNTFVDDETLSDRREIWSRAEDDEQQ